MILLGDRVIQVCVSVLNNLLKVAAQQCLAESRACDLLIRCLRLCQLCHHMMYYVVENKGLKHCCCCWFKFTGIIQSVRVLADRRLQHERRSRAAVEQELAKFRVYCQAQEREIATLRGILRKHGLTLGDDGLAARAAVAAATISVVAEVNSSADITAVEQLASDVSTVEALA